MVDARGTQLAALDRLVAIQEIQELACRYALAIDTHDGPLLESLWVEVPDPVEFPDMNVHTMRDHVIPRLGRIGRTFLFVSNHLVELDDADHAHGTVYTQAQIDEGPRFNDQVLVYEDRYQRVEGRWLFVVRRHLLWYGETRSSHPLEQPPADWPRGQVGRGVVS